MTQQLLEYPLTIAPSRSEAYFELLYGGHMKPFAKRSRSEASKTGKHDNDRQWVFVGSKERMKSLATRGTLHAVVADPAVDTTYYTPNGYYRRDQRLTENLRWLNAYVFDLDTTGETLQDVFDRTDQAGLPRPTAVVQTPSGGYHIHYFFTDSVRAMQRAVQLYTAIMGHVAHDLGADPHAVGANRIFRTPTEQNLIHFDPACRYDFDLFKAWRELNHPFEPNQIGYISIHTGNLMKHPALQQLLNAPCQEGNRDKTAFTLALAMRASDWPQEQAEDALAEWFVSCCSKGSTAGKAPFTRRDAIYKAEYVYRNPSLHAPAADSIRELTGMPFYYQTRNNWEIAKPRAERERIHLSEWSADLVAFLEAGQQLSGTQQELATRLNCPLASFKLVINQLKTSGRIIVETRKGRGGSTTISLPAQKQGPQPVNIKTEEPTTAYATVEYHETATNDTREAALIQKTVIIHADFQTHKINRIERLISPAHQPAETDPGPPD